VNPRVLYENVLRRQREMLEAEEKAADVRFSTKRFEPAIPHPRPFVPPIRRYRREFATAEERQRARAALVRRGLAWVLG
jgi:hypothetical protein